MKGKYSYEWLQSFFEDVLPSPEEVGEKLLRHSLEVESIDQTDDKSDTIFTLDVLPNRAVDCLSHYGVAKEISAVCTAPLRVTHFTQKNTIPYQKDVKRIVVKTSLCPRYTVTHLLHCTYDTTPPWMRSRLEAIGKRCVHPIVDIVNYLLFEIGHPMHVFDADKIQGGLAVREARDGEQFITIDEQKVSLQAGDIVIVDTANDTILALGGIKGGKVAMVDENTKNILLEAATFNHERIRLTMRRTDLVTDAALRFSQGYPSELIDYTLRHALTLLTDMIAPEGKSMVTYEHRAEKLRSQMVLGIATSDVNTVLGTDFTKQQVTAVFSRLGIEHSVIITPQDEMIDVARTQIGTPYRYGASILRDAPECFDCSGFVAYCAAHAGKTIPRISINQYITGEEVAKEDIEGGDLVFFVLDSGAKVYTESVFEAATPVTPGTVPGGINHCGIVTDTGTIIHAVGSSGENMVVEESLKAVLQRLQKHEACVGYRRIWHDTEDRIVVRVPVERIDIARKIDLVEEVGRISGYDAVPTRKPKSRTKVAIHQQLAHQWRITEALNAIGFSEVVTYTFQKKSDVCVSYPLAADKACLRSTLADGLREALNRNAQHGELLGGEAVRLFEFGTVFSKDGEEVHLALGIASVPGRPKVVSEKIAEEVRVALSTLDVTLPGSFNDGVWEVALSPCIADKPLQETYTSFPSVAGVQYRAPSRYPFVLRDISVFVPSTITASDIGRCIDENAGALLRQRNLFDVFSRDDKVSFAFRLVFQSDDKTLTDDEVTVVMDHVTQALQKESWEVR